MIAAPTVELIVLDHDETDGAHLVLLAAMRRAWCAGPADAWQARN